MFPCIVSDPHVRMDMRTEMFTDSSVYSHDFVRPRVYLYMQLD